MSAYLCVAIFMHCCGVIVTMRTKPGAPRKPEPGADVLMAVLLVHFSLLVWASYLLFKVVA